MAAQLDAINEAFVPPADLVIELVRDEDTLRTWIHTLAPMFGISEDDEKLYVDIYLNTGFELPRRYYIGSLDGESVATVLIYYGAGVAGLNWMSTSLPFQRRGIGAAMALTALREARELGYQISVL